MRELNGGCTAVKHLLPIDAVVFVNAEYNRLHRAALTYKRRILAFYRLDYGYISAVYIGEDHLAVLFSSIAESFLTPLRKGQGYAALSYTIIDETLLSSNI